MSLQENCDLQFISRNLYFKQRVLRYSVSVVTWKDTDFYWRRFLYLTWLTGVFSFLSSVTDKAGVCETWCWNFFKMSFVSIIRHVICSLNLFWLSRSFTVSLMPCAWSLCWHRVDNICIYNQNRNSFWDDCLTADTLPLHNTVSTYNVFLQLFYTLYVV